MQRLYFFCIFHSQTFHCIIVEQTIDKSQFTAAILAGGKNTRFDGRTKAKMIIRGKPLIEHILGLLETIFDDIIIITNNKSELVDYNKISMYGDIYHDRGPLGGLHSALTNAGNDNIFLIASDMPDVNGDLIRRLLSQYSENECDAMLPSHNGQIEPLHAIYSKSILKLLDTYLTKSDSFAIRDFLVLVNLRYFEVSDIVKRNLFRNINTQDDLDSYLNA